MAKVWAFIFLGIFCAILAIIEFARLLVAFKYEDYNQIHQLLYMTLGLILWSASFLMQASLHYFKIAGHLYPLVAGILGLVGGVIIMIGVLRMLNK